MRLIVEVLCLAPSTFMLGNLSPPSVMEFVYLGLSSRVQ